MSTGTATSLWTELEMISNIASMRRKLSNMTDALNEITGSRQVPILLDSDIEEESPYEPQVTKYMQTKEQKERAAKELNDRKDAFALKRRIKIDKRRLRLEMEKREKHKVRRDRLKSKRKSERLPNEMWLDIMRHTHINDIDKLARSNPVMGEIFRSNQKAIFRGMEDEQFSELKWLFGDSSKRTPAQKQALKDSLILHDCKEDSKETPEILLKMLDNNQLTGRIYIKHLQLVLDMATELKSSICISLRSALCITMFGAISGDESEMMERRINMIDRQPSFVQVEICGMLEFRVSHIMSWLDHLHEHGGDVPMLGSDTVDWIQCYFSPEKVDHKMDRSAMGRWIAEMATGYILEPLLQGEDAIPAQMACRILNQGTWFNDVLQAELENSGSTSELWKGARDFAKRIGFNSMWMLEGTEVGLYLREN